MNIRVVFIKKNPKITVSLGKIQHIVTDVRELPIEESHLPKSIGMLQKDKEIERNVERRG